MTTELSDGILAPAVLRSVYASDGTLKVDADKLRRELHEIGHAIVAVPDREIADDVLAATQYGYHLKNGTADNLGAHQRARLLAAGYHVTRIVADEDHKQDIAIEGFHAALRALAPLLDVDAPKAIGTDVAAKELADAIRKKFAPAEADSIEEQTQKTMDEIVFESAVYAAGLDVARWIFCGGREAYSPPSALKNRLSDAIDQGSLPRGELKPRAPKKGPTLEDLMFDHSGVTISPMRDGSYMATSNYFHDIIAYGPTRWDVKVEAEKQIADRFREAIANGEDLPMPGEGK